jgi:hypothetical protein
MDGEFLCSRHHIAIDCGYLIIGSGSDDGQIAGEKDLTEAASSSVMSKTVNSFVICNRARTLLVRCNADFSTVIGGRAHCLSLHREFILAPRSSPTALMWLVPA